MKILISNDDGVHAPGINILKDVLSENHEVTVVAPLEERSTTGHTLTLDHPLRVVEIDKDIYACSGYPADCTLMGIAHILKNERPDIVISGINRGANLGQDIYYSGTVAAAREAVFHNVPAIAVSLVVDFQKIHQEHHYYTSAAKVVEKILEKGIHEKMEPMSLLNVNVPNLEFDHIKGVKSTQLGFRRYSEEIQQRFDFRERPYYWVGGVYSGFDKTDNSDCQAVEDNYVSISNLNLLNFSSDKSETWNTFAQEILS